MAKNHSLITIIILFVLNSVEGRPVFPFANQPQGYELSLVNLPAPSRTMNDNEIGFDEDDLALDNAADTNNLNLDPESEECVKGMEDMPQYQRSSRDNIVVMFDDAVMLALPDCDSSKVPNKCPEPTTQPPFLGLVVPQQYDPNSDQFGHGSGVQFPAAPQDPGVPCDPVPPFAPEPPIAPESPYAPVPPFAPEPPIAPMPPSAPVPPQAPYNQDSFAPPPDPEDRDGVVPPERKNRDAVSPDYEDRDGVVPPEPGAGKGRSADKPESADKPDKNDAETKAPDTTEASKKADDSKDAPKGPTSIDDDDD